MGQGRDKVVGWTPFKQWSRILSKIKNLTIFEEIFKFLRGFMKIFLRIWSEVVRSTPSARESLLILQKNCIIDLKVKFM